MKGLIKYTRIIFTHSWILLFRIFRVNRRKALDSKKIQDGKPCYDDDEFKKFLKSASNDHSDNSPDKVINNDFFSCFNDKQQFIFSYKSAFKSEYDETIKSADSFCQHYFNLLGSGRVHLGNKIPWHTDFITNYTWPKEPTAQIKYKIWDKQTPYDIKVPWELSRCYHFITLGQAYWFTNDEKYTEEFISQFSDWINENQVGIGVNWKTTMEIAIRNVNWIWAYNFFKHSKIFTKELKYKFIKSIYRHTRYIYDHLEYGPILGNHFFSDIVGLVYGAIFFKKFNKSKVWLKKGINELNKEIINQFNSDGANFEQSTSYHRLVLEMALSAKYLLNSNQIQLQSDAKNRLEDAMKFIESLTKPDGTMPCIGDADDGRLHIFCEYSRKNINDHRYLLDYLNNKKSPESIWITNKWKNTSNDKIPTTKKQNKFFKDSGLYVIENDLHHLVIHNGNVGQRGWGGHSHNDQLSFDYSYDKKQIIIDSGTYNYTGDPKQRNYFRSTKAHNTIQIDDQEINNYRNRELFALVDDVKSPSTKIINQKEIELTHNGYLKLNDPIKITRKFILSKELNIVDHIRCQKEHKINIYFHFDKNIKLEIIDKSVLIKYNKQVLKLLVDNFDEIAINDCWISSSYGIKYPSKKIVITLNIKESSIIKSKLILNE